MKFLKNDKAFSIMGVLVASAIGLIVIIGLTKLFVHMNSQIGQLERQAQRSILIGLLGNAINNNAYCKDTLLPMAPNLKAGQKQKIYEIKSGGGNIVDLTASNLQSKYGIEGLTYFEVKCAQSSCDCRLTSGATYPCTKRWSLALISQSKVSNVPTFNRIMEIPFTVTYTSHINYDNFTCN